MRKRNATTPPPWDALVVWHNRVVVNVLDALRQGRSAYLAAYEAPSPEIEGAGHVITLLRGAAERKAAERWAKEIAEVRAALAGRDASPERPGLVAQLKENP